MTHQKTSNNKHANLKFKRQNASRERGLNMKKYVILLAVMMIAACGNPTPEESKETLSGSYLLDVDSSDYFKQLELLVTMQQKDEDAKDREDGERLATAVEYEKTRDARLNINEDNSFMWKGGRHYCEIKDVGVVQGVKCFSDKEEAVELNGKERSGANINLTIRKTSDGLIITNRKDAKGKAYIKD